MATPTFHDGNDYTVVAGATMGQFLRVKVDASGELQLAAAADAAIGYLTERGATANENAAVRGAAASMQCAVASKAIAVGDVVYGDAGGKVTDVITGGVILGIARDAAAADGDLLVFYTSDKRA